MYSATRVNQFEMKDTCFQFVINVSRQGNIVKMKYNLQRLQSCLVLSRHIHNPVKQVIWSVLQKQSTVKYRQLFLQLLHTGLNTSLGWYFTGFWIRLCFFYYSLHIESIKFRSGRSKMSFKIQVFKNIAIFTGKHLCWSLFVIKLLAYKTANLLKRDSNTSVFLLILPNF